MNNKQTNQQEETLDSRIIKKQQRIYGLSKVMDVLFTGKMYGHETQAQIEDEKTRLECRLKELEEKGLEDKIATYERVLTILQDNGISKILRK